MRKVWVASLHILFGHHTLTFPSSNVVCYFHFFSFLFFLVVGSYTTHDKNAEKAKKSCATCRTVWFAKKKIAVFLRLSLLSCCNTENLLKSWCTCQMAKRCISYVLFKNEKANHVEITIHFPSSPVRVYRIFSAHTQRVFTKTNK